MEKSKVFGFGDFCEFKKGKVRYLRKRACGDKGKGNLWPKEKKKGGYGREVLPQL